MVPKVGQNRGALLNDGVEQPMGRLGDARRQPTHMRQLLHGGSAETPEASKTLEQLPLAFLPDSRDLVQCRLESRFPAQ